MRRAPLALALAALAACADPAPSGPTPLAVVPAQATPDAAIDVEISGRGFEPVVHTDYGDAARSTVEASFGAALAPAGGGPTVALEAVSFTARRTLAARVPAGLPTGGYDLVVVDPRGRSGALRDAFRVVTSSESVATFRFAPLDPQAAGIPFRVVITAVDAQGRTVEGFAGDVAMEDLAGAVSPPRVGPFALGRASALVTVAAVLDPDRLTARDALGHAGASDPFAVTAGPPVAIAFVAAPAAPHAGACAGPVELELRDALGHPARAIGAVAVRLDAAPPGALAFFTDGGCATAAPTVEIAAGASGASFRLRAAAAGTATVRAVPASIPAATLDVAVAP